MKSVSQVREDMSEVDQFAEGFRMAMDNPSLGQALMSEEE